MNKNKIRNTLAVFPEIFEIDYGSQIDSADLNRLFNSLEESCLRSILRGKDLNSWKDKLTLGVLKSYEALSLVVDTPKINLNDNFITGPVAYRSNIDVDTTQQYILHKKSQFSKIPRGNGYDGAVSPNVTVLLDGIEQSQGSDIYDTLDGTNKSFWIQTISDEDPHEVEIRLPPSITKRFNYVEVYPFPIFGIDIEAIEYLDFYGNYVSCSQTKTDQIDTIKRFGGIGRPIILYLSPKECNNAFKIKFRSKNGLGVIGFSNIDFKFIDFDFNIGTLCLPFEIPSSLKSDTYAKGIQLDALHIDYYLDNSENIDATNPSSDHPVIFRLKQGVLNPNNGNIVPKNPVHNIDLRVFNGIKLDQILRLHSTEALYLECSLREYNVTSPVILGARISRVVG